MGMNVDGNLGTEIGKNPKGGDRNADLVADSVNIDDDARGSFLHQLPAQVSEHKNSTRSITPTMAASIGEFGSPTDVIAENPSGTARTRSPTPASTASSATTTSPAGWPSRSSG